VKASAAGRSATVRWTAPEHSGSSKITAYRIRRYVGTGTKAQATTTVSGAVRRLVVRHLHRGHRYSFDVTAVNASGLGLVSARSSSVRPPRHENAH
jgi:hypothetical protein